MLHHAQHIDGFSVPSGPIPYVGAPASRNRDIYVVTRGPRPRGVWASYIRFRCKGQYGNGTRFWRLFGFGESGSGGSVTQWEQDDSPGVAKLIVGDGSGNSADPITSTSPAPGAITEFAHLIRWDTGESRAIQRTTQPDGSTQLDAASVTPASWSLPANLGGANPIVYNMNPNRDAHYTGAKQFYRHYVADGSALDSGAFGGTASAVMDELAAYHLDPAA